MIQPEALNEDRVKPKLLCGPEKDELPREHAGRPNFPARGANEMTKALARSALCMRAL